MNRINNELNNGWIVWTIMCLLSFYLVATNADASTVQDKFYDSLTTSETQQLVGALQARQSSVITAPDYTILVNEQYNYANYKCHDLVVYLSANNKFLSSVCHVGGDWVFIK